MRRTINNHDHLFSDEELHILSLILEGPKSLKELVKAGAKVTSKNFFNTLLKYEFAGILLYEEPVKNYDKMVRYGFCCIKAGSYAEGMFKELQWKDR